MYVTDRGASTPESITPKAIWRVWNGSKWQDVDTVKVCQVSVKETCHTPPDKLVGVGELADAVYRKLQHGMQKSMVKMMKENNAASLAMLRNIERRVMNLEVKMTEENRRVLDRIEGGLLQNLSESTRGSSGTGTR
jgi:hypothetical protein